jgi:hypothetical protein
MRINVERAIGVHDGRIYLIGAHQADSTYEADRGLRRARVSVVAYNLDGTTPVHIASFRGPSFGYERRDQGVRVVHIPFMSFSSVDMVPNGLLIADAEGSFLEMLDHDGQPIGRITLSPTLRQPVTDDHIDAYIEAFAEKRPHTPVAVWSDWRRTLSMLPLPPDLPSFSRLVVGNDGRVWVQAYRLPDQDENEVLFTVMNRESGAKCMHIPNTLKAGPDLAIGADVLDIGRDYVLGVVEDTLGVERVRLWRFVDPSP